MVKQNWWKHINDKGWSDDLEYMINAQNKQNVEDMEMEKKEQGHDMQNIARRMWLGYWNMGLGKMTHYVVICDRGILEMVLEHG